MRCSGTVKKSVVDETAEDLGEESLLGPERFTLDLARR